MPRLLGLQISGGWLAARVVVAIILGGFCFFVFYLIPTLIPSLLRGFFGPAGLPLQLAGLMDQLVPPTLPTFGLLIAILVPLGVVFRNTKIYGPLLILIGLSFAAYLFLLFGGGSKSISVPEIFPGLTAQLQFDFRNLFLLFVLGPILTIVKGSLVAVERARR